MSKPTVCAFLVLVCTACASPQINQVNQIKPLKAQTPAPKATEAVVTYHPIATQIGLDILKRGGNAFDAFVASTAAEYVLGEGVTSLAGPLAAMAYVNKTKTSVFLDGDFNQPLDSRQKWSAEKPRPGAAVLVSGAAAGLESLSKTYGKLSFKEALEPAIALAENGFPVSRLYAALISNVQYTKLLQSSDYGRKTFFKNGEPLKEGDTLRLPELAGLLRHLAEQGSRYMYDGAWANECVDLVKKEGGHLTRKDFTDYRAEWRKPWTFSYRGYEIATPQDTGGLNTALSLKLLEHADLRQYGTHYSESAAGLELLTRIKNEVDAERWLHDEAQVEDSAAVASMFTIQHRDELWARVQQQLAQHSANPLGSHSYQIVIVDREGNAITGTNTIESFPWGNGLFVEGVPLTASGQLPFATKPGHRRLTMTSMQLGFEKGELRFAAGAFSFSLLDAEFQFLVNLIDYKLPVDEALAKPRFGNHAWDIQAAHLKSTNSRWLDSRIDGSIVDDLAARGLQYAQYGFVDTGLGAAATIDADGNVASALVPTSSNGVKPDPRAGIGAGLQPSPEGETVISLIVANSPAEHAGLKKGDVITKVQPDTQKPAISAEGLTPAQILNLIRGKNGEAVGLDIRRSGGEIEHKQMIRVDISKLRN